MVDECDNMADCIASCTRQQEIEPCPYLHFECFNSSFSYIEQKTGKKKFWFERHCAPNFENDCGGEFACALADHANSTDCKVSLLIVSLLLFVFLVEKSFDS